MTSADIFDSLREASHDFLAYLTAIPSAGWVLIGIALLVGLWAYSLMHAATRIGSIEVDDLKVDAPSGAGSKPLLILALTAGFRQRLWRVGLAPPPAVPEGSPQANLITAIEGVGPTGTTIGKFLEALPTPPQPARYKVTATLTGVQVGSACGVSYTLLPLGRGAAHLDAIESCKTHADALNKAAVQIYLHIARSLPDVFPTWVRWRTAEALDAYLDGCTWRTGGDLDEAARRLEFATEESPFNALAALQLANLDERRASAKRPGINQKWRTAYFQARALARYLDTARMWPTVVEARYRTSVVSSGLASIYDDLIYVTEREAIRTMVPLFLGGRLATDAEYADRLRNLAGLESHAAVQLLQPFYVIIREQRLRNQFEPRGRDRSRLRNGVRISRNCAGMRVLNDRAKSSEGGREARRRSMTVMGLSLLGISWQARYNVACFETLRLAGKYVDAQAEPRIERRALRTLGRAIRESAGELTRAWVKNDPDMAHFSKAVGKPRHAAWLEVVNLAPEGIIGDPLSDRPTSATESPTAPSTSSAPPVPSAGAVINSKSGTLVATMPARPWGNPTARWRIWLAAIILLVLVAAFSAFANADPVAAVVGGGVALLLTWLSRNSRRERDLGPTDPSPSKGPRQSQ